MTYKGGNLAPNMELSRINDQGPIPDKSKKTLEIIILARYLPTFANLWLLYLICMRLSTRFHGNGQGPCPSCRGVSSALSGESLEGGAWALVIDKASKSSTPKLSQSWQNWVNVEVWASQNNYEWRLSPTCQRAMNIRFLGLNKLSQHGSLGLSKRFRIETRPKVAKSNTHKIYYVSTTLGSLVIIIFGSLVHHKVKKFLTSVSSWCAPGRLIHWII